MSRLSMIAFASCLTLLVTGSAPFAMAHEETQNQSQVQAPAQPPAPRKRVTGHVKTPVHCDRRTTIPPYAQQEWDRAAGFGLSECYAKGLVDCRVLSINETRTENRPCGGPPGAWETIFNPNIVHGYYDVVVWEGFVDPDSQTDIGVD